jgi:hypothetical protein
MDIRQKFQNFSSKISNSHQKFENFIDISLFGIWSNIWPNQIFQPNQNLTKPNISNQILFGIWYLKLFGFLKLDQTK